MSEVTHLIFAPGDSCKKFNREIRRACSEVPVTHFEACLIKGGGVKLSLFTDYAEADEDDVAADEDGDIKLGDTIIDGAPCCAYLVATNVMDKNQKVLTEERLDKLADLCKSSVTEEINLTGQDFAWVAQPGPDGQPDPQSTPIYLPVTVSYTLIVFEIMPSEEEDGAGEDVTEEEDGAGEDVTDEEAQDDPNDPVDEDDDAPPTEQTTKKQAGKKKATKKKATKKDKPQGDE